MTRRILQSIGAAALACSLYSGTAFAHEEHCHMKDADKKFTDAKGFKDQKSCEANGGIWRHHHLHCHKAGPDGNLKDLLTAKTPKACVAKGGRWTDHGHEGLEH